MDEHELLIRIERHARRRWVNGVLVHYPEMLYVDEGNKIVSPSAQ